MSRQDGRRNKEILGESAVGARAKRGERKLTFTTLYLFVFIFTLDNKLS
jgi:hypothetical protein